MFSQRDVGAWIDGCSYIESVWASLDTHKHLVGRFAALRKCLSADATLTEESIIELSKQIMKDFPNPLTSCWEVEFKNDLRKDIAMIVKVAVGGVGQKRSADQPYDDYAAADGWTKNSRGSRGRGGKGGKGGKGDKGGKGANGAKGGKGGKGAKRPVYPGVCYAYSTKLADGCKYGSRCRFKHECVCCGEDHIASVCPSWDMSKDSRLAP